MKDTIKSKSNPNLTGGAPKDNERYCNNSNTSNGNSFITNKNLLNTSMSPIHKVNTKQPFSKYTDFEHLNKVGLNKDLNSIAH